MGHPVCLVLDRVKAADTTLAVTNMCDELTYVHARSLTYCESRTNVSYQVQHCIGKIADVLCRHNSI